MSSWCAQDAAPRELAGVPEAVRPPVRPVKGMTLRLDAGDGVRLRRTVRGLVHGRACYLVPRDDGTLVVGATVEEKGYDLSVQVGAVAELLDTARRLVPGIDEYELRETTTGLRPGSPDNGPLVGPSGIEGLLYATGHYRHGVLLAPVTAAYIADLLADAGSPRSPALVPLFAPFDPRRFEPHHAGARCDGPPRADEREPASEAVAGHSVRAAGTRWRR